MYERCQTETFTWKGVRTWKPVLFCSHPIRLFYSPSVTVSIHLRYTCFFSFITVSQAGKLMCGPGAARMRMLIRGVIDPPRSLSDLRLTRRSPAVDLEGSPLTLKRTHTLSLSYTHPHTCTKGKSWVRTSHLIVSSWLLALMWMRLRMKEGSGNIQQLRAGGWITYTAALILMHSLKILLYI